MSRRGHRGEKGFTLIEVIVTLLVLAIVGGFVGRPLIGLVQTRANLNDSVASQADRDYALTRMAQAVRLSTPAEPVLCDTGPATLSVGDTEFVFNADQSALSLDGERLVSGIDSFDCTELEPGDLRLVELSIDGQSVRAFKREI